MSDIGVLFEQPPHADTDSVESEIKFTRQIEQDGFIACLLQAYACRGAGTAC